MFTMLPGCLQKRQCELSDIMKCWGKRPWHRTVSDVWELRWTVDFVSYIEVQIFKGSLPHLNFLLAHHGLGIPVVVY